MRVLAFILLVITLVLAATGAATVAQETPTPARQGVRGSAQASGYTGQFAELQTAIDTFWSNTFQAAGIDYRSPQVSFVEQLTSTKGCGIADPNDWPFYCPPDETIYLQPNLLNRVATTIGDYAPIMILAHEWAHHVQTITNTPRLDGKTLELQADCLAGVYTQEAAQQGLLDPGDVTEGVLMSKEVGDPPWLAQDNPQAHGINDERISASSVAIPMASATASFRDSAPLKLLRNLVRPAQLLMVMYRCRHLRRAAQATSPQLLSRVIFPRPCRWPTANASALKTTTS